MLCLGPGLIVAIVIVIIFMLTIVGGIFYWCNLRKHDRKCFSKMDIKESNSGKSQRRKNRMFLLILICFLCLFSSQVKIVKA